VLGDDGPVAQAHGRKKPAIDRPAAMLSLCRFFAPIKKPGFIAQGRRLKRDAGTLKVHVAVKSQS
jgi:hypothetical protein